MERIIDNQSEDRIPPKHLFDFMEAKVQIDAILNSWTEDCREAEMRRNERYVELDVISLRQSGEIAEDETMVPDRVIDGNIKREKSETMSFLNAGYRLAIFDCISDPTIDSSLLEEQITKGLTYSGWYRDFDRWSDGAALFGKDYMEVVFDATKPLHVAFEHVGFDYLFYNRGVESPHDSENVLRLYEMTVSQLEQRAEMLGFDPIQVDNITRSHTGQRRSDLIKVYKNYFKDQGAVYISWYCRESGVQDWLKPPLLLRLGIYEKSQTGSWIPSNVTSFPITTYIYCEDEQKKLIDKKGRGFLDSPQQEANTAIVTAFVNGAVRSSFVYASPDVDDTDSSELKQLDMALTPDGIYNKPMRWFSKPAPDVTMLQAIQLIDTKGAVQSGKTAFAANNRKDSRKTAEELKQAQDTETKITSTGLANFSEALRELFEFSWAIIQSQALQNKIPLLLIPAPQDPLVQTGQIDYTNNVEVIGQKFDIRPAGNTDVVEAQQEQAKMMQDWPVIQSTPMKDDFLADYIKIRYPKNADRYLQLLKQGGMIAQLQQAKQLIPALNTALTGALSPEDMQALTPEQQQQLQAMQVQATQFAQTPI